ncbi:unnamed protein product [Phaedon cochleariae]|uniref:CWF19-like protein 2 n=1 Tax=Phaedon cochleariae TaxID=80249 RepID=A0A9P0GQA9_PHACE|nr:unnamed protein product [Phaedon cochleariae]
MGKHKSKSKKNKKDKKISKRSQGTSSEEEWVEKKIVECSSSEEDKTVKKVFNGRRKYRSSSNDSISSDEDGKRSRKNKRSRYKSSSSELQYKEKCGVSNSDLNSDLKRDNWMNLPTSFSTSSTLERKTERENQKRLQREKEQYNPRECTRELNPYWKDGGDGLPKFQRPESDEEKPCINPKSGKYSSRSSNWRKPRDVSKQSTSKSTTVEKQGSDIDERVSESVVTTEKELNMLAAKLVKAEIMGNTKLINELKNKLENARSSLELEATNEEEVILTHTDSKGKSQPVRLQSDYNEPSVHKKKKKVETHKDGERIRYFADDDKYSLKQMFENEKYNSVEDQNKEFLEMTSKISKQDDMDDLFSDNIRKSQSDLKIDAKNRDRAISEHKKVTKSLENCIRCIQSESMPKHLMISMGETAYLSLPTYEPLTEGHCLIIPIRHVPCSTQLDENEWSNILDFRRALVNLFRSKGEDVIFFEYAMYFHKFPHMLIECVPLPKEDGDMAPIYFRKAIDESETEWSQNKKLVSLKGRDVRKAIPKGLPYFFVSFGMEEGYAHVIEDEELFPTNFAQEVIGGMLDLHHSKWRRPKSQQFQEQSKRVLEFSKEWKNFDCTANVS